MPTSNPEPDYDAFSDEELQESLVQARHGLALNERSRAVKQQLAEDWERYRALACEDAETGASPVSLLKLEAMAAIAALADFHCHMSHELLDRGLETESHGWAVDEGFLNAAFTILTHVNTEDL